MAEGGSCPHPAFLCALVFEKDKARRIDRCRECGHETECRHFPRVMPKDGYRRRKNGLFGRRRRLA